LFSKRHKAALQMATCGRRTIKQVIVLQAIFQYDKNMVSSLSEKSSVRKNIARIMFLVTPPPSLPA
jgi:hypothetical protein